MIIIEIESHFHSTLKYKVDCCPGNSATRHLCLAGFKIIKMNRPYHDGICAIHKATMYIKSTTVDLFVPPIKLNEVILLNINNSLLKKLIKVAIFFFAFYEFIKSNLFAGDEISTISLFLMSGSQLPKPYNIL